MGCRRDGGGVEIGCREDGRLVVGSGGKVFSWRFDPSQPQGITSRLNTEGGGGGV